MNIDTIHDVDDLYRRVAEYWIKESGEISTAAFQNAVGTDEMSVDLGRLTTPKTTALDESNYGVASFLAGVARELEQEVFHSPTQDNVAHSTVKGQKTKSMRKKLSSQSKLILWPANIKNPQGSNL